MKVYAGLDPITGRRLYLTDSTTDEREAERIRTRLLADVDAKRNAQTRGTLGAALDKWLLLREHRARYELDAARLRTPVSEAAFLFSYSPARDKPYNPSGVTHKYARMCEKLGIDRCRLSCRPYWRPPCPVHAKDFTASWRLAHQWSTASPAANAGLRKRR